MSAPTWTPAKLALCELLHGVVAVLTGAPPACGVVTSDEFEVDFRVTSPPMARAQTPPPG